ncbi:hypothetical protein C8Q73DRAFT_699790 [Cubamyces lactineus]|nr:hypothetical protein C8Q73DRAFT_699790 [Cubamyces lactineus]
MLPLPPPPSQDPQPHDPSSSAHNNHHHHHHQPSLYHVVSHHSLPQNPVHHHPYPVPPQNAPFDQQQQQHHPQQLHPALPHSHPHHPHIHHLQQNQTCVPALIPPGMDPSQVDIRTFYPYTPNEVKHRKRTTRAQLKVLEGVYKYDTKPNASLRKKLAAELDMTPRGVQVWFQNRRAKTKQQAKKAEAAKGSPSDPSTSATAAAAASNPPIAPRPTEDAPDDDNDDPDEPCALAPPSPKQSEDTAPENAATADGTVAASSNANPNASAQQDNEQSHLTPDSRRSSMAPPLPRSPAWLTSSPSVSTAPAPSSTAPSSALSSPNPANHANNSHVRLSTHPPSATSSYSHNHLAPTDIYSQRRTSLPPSLSSTPGNALGMLSTLRRRGGYDPNVRRRSTDMGGHRIVAHPYVSVAQSANGPHHMYADGDDAAPIRRPMLMQRMTTPYASNHSQGTQAMHSPQAHPQHAHSQPILPSQAQQQRAQHLGQQRQHYDISPIQVSISHSQGYNQPPNHPGGHGYDLFAPRHSIDGSALGLTQAHAQMSMGLSPLHSAPVAGMDSDAFSMGLGMSNHYVVSQRPLPATIPGPLPSPNFSFGNPFAPAANDSPSGSSMSNSASGTPPNGASPPLLSLRRTSESALSDGDTEESSGAPLSRFGSIASINGSEASWTSAYVSDSAAEGEEGDGSTSRKMSCASEFLGMFSGLDVGSSGGTPAPHGMQEPHTLRQSRSSSHLSPNAFVPHHMQAPAHSPSDAVELDQQQQQQQQHIHMHAPSDTDGYPSPSSASTVSAGSNHGNGGSHPHTMSHDTTPSHTTVGNGNGGHLQQQGANSMRNHSSSELAYALQGEPEPAHGYQQHPQVSAKEELQYPMYVSQETGEADASDAAAYAYAQEQAHHGHREYAKAQMGHFPTLYEGYVYPHGSTNDQIPEEDASAMNEAYAAGAIELSHMCVPASEGVHFMGGYMQYS